MSDAHSGPRLRPDLDALPRYRAGRPAAVGQNRTYKLSSNENPFPPLPSVMAAINDAAATINRYPDITAAATVAAIAASLGVGVEQIALGTGSVAVLQHAIQIACTDGDEVVYAWRSFEAYPIITRIAGAVPVEVPVTDDGFHDLDAMAAAITDRTRVVIVCSPNNPTGTTVAADALEAFLAKVPREVLVVLDEAYVEFVTDPAALAGLNALAQHPNVVVMRTFSKAYGLAGLRVGYAVAAEPIADALRAVSTPFGVSAIAQRAVVASLGADAQQEMRRRVAVLVEERSRVVDALREQGWTIADQQANFVWLGVGPRSTELSEHCAAAGLMVRPYGDDGVRITIGELLANDRVIDTLKSFASG